jgi:hypothetical protein
MNAPNEKRNAASLERFSPRQHVIRVPSRSKRNAGTFDDFLVIGNSEPGSPAIYGKAGVIPAAARVVHTNLD